MQSEDIIGIEDKERKTILILSDLDILYACKDKELLNMYQRMTETQETTDEFKKQFIEQYKDRIDKEKLLLSSVRNYRREIEFLDKEISKMEEKIEHAKLSEINNKYAKLTIKQLKDKLNVRKNELKKAIKACKGIDRCESLYTYDSEKKEIKIDILDSKELLGEGRGNVSKKSQKLDKFFNSLRDDINVEGVTGLSYFLTNFRKEDYGYVFPNESFGNDIMHYICDYYVFGGTKVDLEKYYEMSKENKEEYTNMVRNADTDELNNIIATILKEYIKYADIDELVIRIAYRLQQGLETLDFGKDEIKITKQILEHALKYCKENKVYDKYKIEIEENDEIKEIQYGPKNIERNLNRFVNDVYVNEETIDSLKRLVYNNELLLYDLSEPIYAAVIETEDMSKLAFTNSNNFRFLLSKYNWTNDEVLGMAKNQGIDSTKVVEILLDNDYISKADIINHYMSGTITEETMQKLLDEIDFSDEINYDQSKEEQSNYDKYLKLCQDITNQSEENLQKFSEELMGSLADELDMEHREEYIQKLEKYYKHGLLKIESIIDWEDESIIARFLDDEVIAPSEVKRLIQEKVITPRYLYNLYNKCVLDANLDYEKRIKALKTGFVSEDNIIQAYVLNLIPKKDMDELIELGYVNKDNPELLKKTLSDYEKNASIVLGDLSALSKNRNNKINPNPNGGMTPDRKPNRSNIPSAIIDPDVREEFICEQLKAYKAVAKMNEDNPFYNYEFYVIPGKSGTLGVDSVVIAERYFKDKDTQEEYSVNNATYFFSYKDLLFLSNLRKSEILKERKGVVFTTNHVVANAKRKGHWADGTIKSVAKIMCASDLSDLKPKERKKKMEEKLSELYSIEELCGCIDKAVEIDGGKYNLSPDKMAR